MTPQRDDEGAEPEDADMNDRKESRSLFSFAPFVMAAAAADVVMIVASDDAVNEGVVDSKRDVENDKAGVGSADDAIDKLSFGTKGCLVLVTNEEEGEVSDDEDKDEVEEKDDGEQEDTDFMSDEECHLFLTALSVRPGM